MTAFYNEPDPYAAQWLENLIAAGHIAPGVVDRRPIQEIEAFELAEFTQCHFFAGIGIWSAALRRAGWSDDRKIWTGSCPCQPFSAAGKQKGFADDRHLWPYWFDLIRQCRPPIAIGEQVDKALAWLDLVSGNLEAENYAFGSVILSAAGFGGAHIRHRNYFVAITDTGNCAGGLADTVCGGAGDESREGLGAQAAVDRKDGGLSRERLWLGVEGSIERLANDDDDARLQGRLGMPERADQCAAGASSMVDGLGNTSSRAGRDAGGSSSPEEGSRSEGRADGERCGDAPVIAVSIERLADSPSRDAFTKRQQHGREHGQQQSDGCSSAGTIRNSRQTRSLDHDNVDWLLCRNPAGEPSWRPVESGTFPLHHGHPSRMGKLRAYGNALDLETATEFCEVVREIADGV